MEISFEIDRFLLTDDRQTDYLKLLSSLTVAMRDEQLRRRLVTAPSPQAAVAILRGLSH